MIANRIEYPSAPGLKPSDANPLKRWRQEAPQRQEVLHLLPRAAQPLHHWWGIFFALNALAMPMIEESLLESRFGSDYITYKWNAPRWIPRLKPWTPGRTPPKDTRVLRRLLLSAWTNPRYESRAHSSTVRTLGTQERTLLGFHDRQYNHGARRSCRSGKTPCV
jgi:hypothetical protein